MIRLAVAGAAGRTGRRVLELAEIDDQFVIAAALGKAGCSTTPSTLRVGERDVPVVGTLETPCDVLIDFSVAEGTMAWLCECKRRNLPMVIGATGHNAEQLDSIREAASVIPIVQASNFSPGIQAILAIVGPLAARLGDDYDVEIIEAHHRHKIDAPSGTALTLADEIATATARTPKESLIFGRSGKVGRRPKGEIGVHAVRMGDIVSSHEIHLSGPGETVTIRHTAHSRDTFAAGALRAAAWIAGTPAGLYSMRDVMG